MQKNPWRKFRTDNWNKAIDVRDFVQKNYTPYNGGSSFLKGPTKRTTGLNNKLLELCKIEKAKGGVLDIDTQIVSSLLTYPAGYYDKNNEIIVGLQTGRPLCRGVNPFGGLRMVRQACESYGYELDDKIAEYFSYRTTHNDGVYRVYTEEMKKVRNSGVITGLPDAYGRGRIIGDYRRVALYGVDYLIKKKSEDKKYFGKKSMDDENVRLLEEIYKQIDFLNKLKKMAEQYGFDISGPAVNGKEAVQWIYFAYLAAIKEQNGAAMSLGRTGTFLDIYFERDLSEGTLNEEQVQEIIDDFMIKLRSVRHLRTPEYNELFAGDPVWITESIGGMGCDGRTLVTKTSYRYLNVLYNLGPSAEPNMTVLWSEKLPNNFKKYCTKVTIDTNSVQYENDDLMRTGYGDDYAISCCVSAMKIGKQMQYFGARCNLPKVLLMAINGGKDEITGEQIGPVKKAINTKYLSYDDVVERYNYYKEWLCGLYVNTMNVIHFMHDKYAYEKIQMALHDTTVERLMAFGVAGLSVIVDSLSAVKYAKVKPVRNSKGLIVDYLVEGEFPKFGTDDDRVDDIAIEIVNGFNSSLKKTPAYRNAEHTLSVLTITSNIVYGKKTGSTPDGRKASEPFAPGANPMHQRDIMGALASLNSVAKLPYCNCMDGISNTMSITPSVLGKNQQNMISNLTAVLDGYFNSCGHHLNVNVLKKDDLMKAMEHPELFPNLTIRVSGYAVEFRRLTKEQQREVIERTFHAKL